MAISQSFPLAWRFDDPAFAQLPRAILDSFVEIGAPEAEALWRRWVHPSESHVAKMRAVVSRTYPTIRTDWDDAAASREQLRNLVRIGETEVVAILWGRRCGIRVQWWTFLEYWDDFFYPSDDNNALIVEKLFLVGLYSEECFSLYTQFERRQ